MITLIISDEQLQASFDKTLDALLTPGTYDNPIKRILDNMLGYNGDKEIKEQMQTYIKDNMVRIMESAIFHEAVGKALATEMAKRQLDAMKK